MNPNANSNAQVHGHSEISLEAHYEQALRALHEGEGGHKLQSFDPAKFADLAKKLAKQTPTILALLSTFGVPIPPGAAQAAQLVVDKLSQAGLLTPASV